MNDTIKICLGIIIPLVGTSLGAAMVFFLKDKMQPMLQKVLLGFASGVMIAASVWSLIIPAIDMAEENGSIPWVPAAVGFLLGIGFLLLLDSITPHLHLNSDKPEGRKAKLRKSTMLIFAVTLHNIPEGMAVGLSFALAAQHGGDPVLYAGAMALAIGIGIQNFPEGAAISLPLRQEGLPMGKSFLYGSLSGIVEPIFGILMVLSAGFIQLFMPWMLAQ